MAKEKIVNTTQKTSEAETKQIDIVKDDFDGFEIWDSSSNKNIIDNPYWIRISKNGSIVISKYLKAEIQDRIQISYNKDKKIIKLKGVGEDQPAVTCLKTKILAKSFFVKYGIKLEEVEKYEAILKDDGCFYVQLK